MRRIRSATPLPGLLLFLTTFVSACASGGVEVKKQPNSIDSKDALIAGAYNDLNGIEERIGGIPPRITSEEDHDRAISDLKEVIRTFSSLIRLYPSDVNLWLGLGSAYGIGYYLDVSGAREAAESSWLWARDLDPENPKPHLALGRFFLETNRIQGAIAELELAKDLDSEGRNPQVLLDLSMAYWYAGRGDEARALVAQFLDRSPDDPKAVEMMELYGGESQ